MKGRIKVTPSGAHAIFDGMTWPRPGVRMSELQYCLTYGTPTKEDLLLAAGIVQAYTHLIGEESDKSRNAKVKRILEAMKIDPKPPGPGAAAEPTELALVEYSPPNIGRTWPKTP